MRLSLVNRLGFLTSAAPYPADVNLFIQMLVLLLLLCGTYLARSGRLRNHGWVMKTVLTMQLGALVFWMGPSVLRNIGALGALGIGPIVTVLHVVSGSLALVLSVSTVSHRPLIARGLRGTMRTTLLAWILTAVLGFSFYLYYYVLK